ncbi:MAG: phage terminase large subunit family protein [Desulfomicrobium sp.]|nr:phage terminase large subunit family protein [Desulfomicrobium sp.]
MMKSKVDLFASFVDQVTTTVKIPETPPGNVGEWAAGDYPGGRPIILDRGPFTFDRHEYLVAPYADDHPCQVERKSTQRGNSTRAFLRMFHAARYLDMVGVLYLFPSKTGIGDFSRSRIAPLVERNPEIIGRFMKDTDSVGLKRFNGVNLLFRGTKSEEGLRSDPADFVIFDEFDLMAEGIEGAAEGRMEHSDYKWKHYLSNPTIPDFGIDRKFQQTDQRFWMLKCPACGGWTCMEDYFNPSIGDEQDIIVELCGEIVRLCQHCRDAALDPARGEWVAKFPSITDMRGYAYSNLWSLFRSPASILTALGGLTTRTKQAFWNYIIGCAFIESDARLSKEQVLALCAGHGIAKKDRGPCWMGVDQGAKYLHVVVGKSFPDRIIYIGILREWEELPGLAKDLGVHCAVIDAQPEQRAAKNAAKSEALAGKAFLNWYNEHAKVVVWDEKNMKVSSPRTETMDDSHEAMKEANVALPADCEPVREFAEHAHNVASTWEEDDEGNRRKVWKKLGPDHYRHAKNYAWMARNRLLGSGFGDCDLS